jgi:hypothetical protein
MPPVLEMRENEYRLADGLNAARELTTAMIAAQIISTFGENGANNIASAILMRTGKKYDY